MAINRFRRIGFTPNTQYTPNIQEDFIPDLSGIEAVMDSLQQQLDETANYDLPKYLRNSPTDVKAFQDYKGKVESYRDNAINAFKSGDLASGQSALRGFGNFIRKSKMPEGDFFELERGVTEYNNALKKLQDTFLDQKSNLYNPYIFQYAKDKLDKGIDPFRDSYGNSRIGINDPILDRYIPDEEVTKQLNEVLDNIEADQIIKGTRVPAALQGLSFKQILERGETEFIDFNKVSSVLANSVSPEIMRSYEMLGNAMGYGQGQGNAVNLATGQFDTSTMLGRKLQGLAESKVFTKNKDKAQIITDSAGLEQYKARLRNANEEFKYRLGNETMRTQVFTNNTGMPKLNYEINEKGEFLKNTNPSYEQDPTGGYLLISPFALSGTPSGQNIFDLMSTQQGREANPAFTQVYDRFAGDVQNMDPKKAYEFLEQKYNEKREALSVADAKVETYGPEMQKARQATLIGAGAGAGLGNINKSRIIVLDTDGRPTEATNLAGFLDKNGITTEEFKKNVQVHGRIESDNPLVASGEELTWADPESGRMITFIASDNSIEELQHNMPVFQLFTPSHKGDITESQYTTTGIPELDNVYGKIQSRANDVYLSDEISERLAKDRTLTQAEKNKLVEQLTDIQRHPEKNVFRYRDVDIYDSRGVNLSEYEGLTLEAIRGLKELMLQKAREGYKITTPGTNTSISLEYTNRQ